MYILKNALTNIKRNPVRNLLVGIIVLVIAVCSTICLAIYNASSTLVNSYLESNPVTASIGMNRSNLMKEMNSEGKDAEGRIEAFSNVETLSLDEIKSYGESSYVSSYYYYYQINMNAKNIEAASDSVIKETTTTTERQGGFGPGGNKTKTTTKTQEEIKSKDGAYTVLGYDSYSAMTDFISGKLKITEGEISSSFEDFNCVISSELASLNDLGVGDTITLVNPSNSKLKYTLTITGIFEEDSEDSADVSKMFSNTVNNIITNSMVINKIISDDEDIKTTINPTYILTSSDAVDSFTEEVSSKGLSSNYQVNTNLESINSSLSSINNVKTFAKTFLIIVLAIGVIVLLVINMINIRERKYEIGVLRTIGMKKSLVMAQFMAELLMVSMVFIMAGAAIGAASSVSVSNKILSSEISKSEENMNNISNNFGGPGKMDNAVRGNAVVKKVDNINAVVDFKVLGELVGIGLVLTIISSLSACVAILKFSPITILKERT